MRPFVKIFFALLVVNLVSAFVLITGANAHEIRPSIVDVDIQKDGKITLEIKLNLEAIVAGIGTGVSDTQQSKNSDKYEAARKLEPAQLKAAFSKAEAEFLRSIFFETDGGALLFETKSVSVPSVGDIELPRTSIITLTAKIPPTAKDFTWSWNEYLGSSVLRVKAENSDKPIFAGMVNAGEFSKPIPLEGVVIAGGFEVFTLYIEQGFIHIVPKGVDHILFVVGLFLLSTKLSSLFWQISSFTIAHTLTLGLAMAGIISAPSSLVEPLIALSIVFVAVENVMTSNLSRWRPFVVFLFGLLHGLGFASVLNDIGLQPGNFIYGLLGFNIGVEIGQLTVILICFLLVGFWFSRKTYYRRYITNPASIAIAAMGGFWFVERVFL